MKLLDEDSSIDSETRRDVRFSQNDHKRVLEMKVDQFLQEIGFIFAPIFGEDYPEEMLPVVGPVDYDINRLLVYEGRHFRRLVGKENMHKLEYMLQVCKIK